MKRTTLYVNSIAICTNIYQFEDDNYFDIKKFHWDTRKALRLTHKYLPETGRNVQFPPYSTFPVC